MAAVIINCFINQEEYQKNELRAIKEFLGVALVCVTIQMKFQSVLMTGFGLSLGLRSYFGHFIIHNYIYRQPDRIVF